jgi:hypothetical protein
MAKLSHVARFPVWPGCRMSLARFSVWPYPYAFLYIYLAYYFSPRFSYLFFLYFSQFPRKCAAIWKAFRKLNKEPPAVAPSLVITLTACENRTPCFGDVATSGGRRCGLCPSESTASETFTPFCFCGAVTQPVWRPVYVCVCVCVRVCVCRNRF